MLVKCRLTVCTSLDLVELELHIMVDMLKERVIVLDAYEGRPRGGFHKHA